MASSPSSRAVLAGQRNNNTRVFVIIITIILLDLSISVESSIFGVRERLTARVGDTVNIPFEYCGLPKPSCTLTQSFNLSSPNPTCTVDRYGHCEVTPALVGDDPLREAIRESFGSCELCVLVIHGVTQKDAGRYAICQTSGACTSSFWSTISTLEVVSENVEPPTSTCTSTKVSTKTNTDSTKTTKPEDAPKNVSEINALLGTDTSPDNTALFFSGSGMSTSSAVGIPITIVILVILFIVGAVYFWKRRNRRQNTPLSPESPYANTKTVTSIDEVKRLRAESESDT